MAVIIPNKTLIVLAIVFLQIWWFPFTNLFYRTDRFDSPIRKPQPSLTKPFPFPVDSNETTRRNVAENRLPYRELLRRKPAATADQQAQAVLDLIERLVPHIRHHFRVIIDSHFITRPDGLDRFRIEPVTVGKLKDWKIQITATTGVAAANAFHYYLKYVANSSVSWSGDQLPTSDRMPLLPPAAIEMIIREKFRYYQNPCTVSYSMVWWQWPRWQREIDWMALNGINLPLAFVGQELVYRRTFERFNLTRTEIDVHFTGPAYLAWNRMGNIRGWGGPLPERWHRQQTVLQHRILARMRQFGMYPVVPGFAGHVPETFQRRHPDAAISRLADWNHFGANYSMTHFLEPTDPYFVRLGVAFVEEYRQLFGTDHFYNIDLFVEETPPSRELDYLARTGRAVYSSIRHADPEAIWLMQGYPFNSLYDHFWGRDQVRALVTAVPTNRLIILDSIAEVIPIYPQTDGYFGQPFIWCILHNYGAVNGMFGSLNRINEAVYDARRRYPQMLGIGVAPEGIHQNDVVYDYMLETPWRDTAPDLNQWFRGYARRRYPVPADDRTELAWQQLGKSVYHDPIGIKNHGRYVFTSRPRPNSHSMLWYDPHRLTEALRLLVQVANDRPELIIGNQTSVTFIHDLVDVARQTMQLVFDHHYRIVDEAFARKQNLDLIPVAMAKAMAALDLTERVLSACQNCLLHNWIRDARLAAAATGNADDGDDQQDYHEWQARIQISIWGPHANIANYGAKQWSGMFQHLYRPRWKLYFDELTKCIERNESFPGTQFKRKLFRLVELPFTRARSQKMITIADTSHLMADVNRVVEEARLTIDRQTEFHFYYNDTERWLDNE